MTSGENDCSMGPCVQFSDDCQLEAGHKRGGAGGADAHARCGGGGAHQRGRGAGGVSIPAQAEAGGYFAANAEK